MISQNLANLAKTSQLKAEPPSRKEFDDLVRSARARLKDAHIETLSIESRFDLGYNGAVMDEVALPSHRNIDLQLQPLLALHTRHHFGFGKAPTHHIPLIADIFSLWQETGLPVAACATSYASQQNNACQKN